METRQVKLMNAQREARLAHEAQMPRVAPAPAPIKTAKQDGPSGKEMALSVLRQFGPLTSEEAIAWAQAEWMDCHSLANVIPQALSALEKEGKVYRKGRKQTSTGRNAALYHLNLSNAV